MLTTVSLRTGRFALLVALVPALLGPAEPARAFDERRMPHPAAVRADAPVSGVVVDASGAPVPGALVRLVVADRQIAEIQTGADGRFTIADAPPGDATITATAPGFAQATLRVPPGADALRIVLQPAPFVESVTVTATRGAERLATPASTSVLTSAELLSSAAGTVDDALRNTPGFSLFRRSSSRVANPTTQGVTLRGVSGSGASRTLVLADGLPLNDPFGSWVYWNKIPQAAIDRVEVVRGAEGDLYGADALGGVIQVLTFAPGRPRLRATFDVASHETVRASVFGGGHARGWIGALSGEWLETDGVPVIARDDRGRADVPATSDYRTGFATIGYGRGPWRALGRFSVYAEDRGNGTPRQVNTTDWRQASGEVSGSAASGVWLARAAGGTQDYYQTFSAVAADRASERLTTEQRTPSTFAVFGGQWARAWGSHVLLVGGEGKRTESTVEEIRYSFTGVPSGPFFAGGTERSGSVFGRTSLGVADRVTVVFGARGDFWKSEPDAATLQVHSVQFFSPRASLSWQATPRVALRASTYRAYRTPTLNELHRGFRVGNTVTNPNPELDPERLTGVEGGVLVAGGRVSARVTGFWNRLDDAISNITIRVQPGLITRQRQNADTVRAAGLEVEADFRPYPMLTVNALAVVTASRFRETPGQPALEGNRIPQVPRYQLGAGITYVSASVATLAAQLRIIGDQFEDDLNQFELGQFAVLDLYASRAIRHGLHAFVAVENLFDEEYDVGVTPVAGRDPVRTVGWPRTVRGGLRLFLP